MYFDIIFKHVHGTLIYSNVSKHATDNQKGLQSLFMLVTDMTTNDKVMKR